MPEFFFVHGAISLCRSAPCGVRSSSHVHKYAPVGSLLQNTPGCAISLLIPGRWLCAYRCAERATCVWQPLSRRDVPPDGGQSIERTWRRVEMKSKKKIIISCSIVLVAILVIFGVWTVKSGCVNYLLLDEQQRHEELLDELRRHE